MDCPLESAKGSSDRNRSPGTKEQERVLLTVPDVKRSFSTAPAPSVRPAGFLVNIVVRNLARVSERPSPCAPLSSLARTLRPATNPRIGRLSLDTRRSRSVAVIVNPSLTASEVDRVRQRFPGVVRAEDHGNLTVRGSGCCASPLAVSRQPIIDREAAPRARLRSRGAPIPREPRICEN